MFEVNLSSSTRDRFDLLENEIDCHRSHGAKIVNCPSCGYEAAVEEPGFSPIYFSHCLLCKAKTRYVRIECSCGAKGIYDGASHQTCTSCKEPFSYSLLVSQNEPKVCGEEHPDTYHGAQAHCHICRKEQYTVFEFDHQWLCLNCLEEHRSPGRCGECETIQTGDIEDSFESGCMDCSGRISWD